MKNWIIRFKFATSEKIEETYVPAPTAEDAWNHLLKCWYRLASSMRLVNIVEI